MLADFYLLLRPKFMQSMDLLVMTMWEKNTYNILNFFFFLVRLSSADYCKD